MMPGSAVVWVKKHLQCLSHDGCLINIDINAVHCQDDGFFCH